MSMFSTIFPQHEEKSARTVAAWLMAVAMMLSMAPADTSAENAVMYVICSPEGTVNIREKANIHSAVSGRLFMGDEVEITARRTDSHGRVWCRAVDVTEYGYGWVYAGYLVTSEPHECDVVATVSASGRVALRAEPDGERIAWIKPGDTLRVTVTSADWSLTEKGYIRTEFLDMTEGRH